MFTDNFKKIAFVTCLLPLVGCGLFSDDKELPQGERISILASGENPATSANLLANVSVPAAYMNDQWAQTGGNARHVIGNPSGPRAMHQLWKADFGKGSSKRKLLITSPIIYQSTVYAQDVEGTVSAFDLESGQKIWKQKIKPLIENEEDNGVNGSGLAAADNLVFATTGFGSIVALNAKTGQQLWRQEAGVPLRTAPTVCGSKLLVQTIDNQILAYETLNGNKLWRYNIPAEDTVLAGSASPACEIEKNLAVAGFSNGEIEALNIHVGYPLWSATLLNSRSYNTTSRISSIKAPVVIDGDMVFAVGNNESFAALDYRTGEKIWERQVGSVYMPWIAGDYIFLLTNNNQVSAFRKTDGKLMWNTALLEEYELKDRADIILRGIVMINSRLYVAASNGKLYMLSSADGRIMDQADTKLKLAVMPVVAEDTVILMTEDAQLIAYR